MNGFFDADAVRERTGRPIRSAWRTPGDPRPFPAPDAVVVAPATFNTINKWAAGIADTLALGTLCEAAGLGVPIAVLPCVGEALAAHPAYRESLRRLAGMGVRLGEPYSGEPAADGHPECAWERALDLLAFPDARTGNGGSASIRHAKVIDAPSKNKQSTGIARSSGIPCYLPGPVRRCAVPTCGPSLFPARGRPIPCAGRAPQEHLRAHVRDSELCARHFRRSVGGVPY